MKRVLIAVCALGLATASAEAVETWQGDIFIKTATTPCVDTGFAEGIFLRSVYKPANVTNNGSQSALSMLTQRSAFHFSRAGKLRNGEWDAVHITGRAILINYAVTASTIKLSPATVQANTQAVTISGSLANFNDTPGCTITFIGTLGNRP